MLHYSHVIANRCEFPVAITGAKRQLSGPRIVIVRRPATWRSLKARPKCEIASNKKIKVFAVSHQL
jgi:hypothetical protein